MSSEPTRAGSTADAAERVFSALADPTRRAILERLAESPLPVHDVAASFPWSRPAISRHLRVLREAGLVHEERRGRERVYAVDRARLEPVASWLEGLHGEAGEACATAATPPTAVRLGAVSADAADRKPEVRRDRDPLDWAPWARR